MRQNAHLTHSHYNSSPFPSLSLNPHQDDVCAGVEPISPTTCVLLACLADVSQCNDDIIIHKKKKNHIFVEQRHDMEWGRR